MKFLLLLVFLMSGCGYMQRNGEMVGQIKTIVHVTPLLCPPSTQVDVSLGIIRNGVGSMSSQDVWLVIEDGAMEEQMKKFADSGQPIKITYNTVRFSVCWPPRQIVKVEAMR